MIIFNILILVPSPCIQIPRVQLPQLHFEMHRTLQVYRANGNPIDRFPYRSVGTQYGRYLQNWLWKDPCLPPPLYAPHSSSGMKVYPLSCFQPLFQGAPEARRWPNRRRPSPNPRTGAAGRASFPRLRWKLGYLHHLRLWRCPERTSDSRPRKGCWNRHRYSRSSLGLPRSRQNQSQAMYIPCKKKSKRIKSLSRI